MKFSSSSSFERCYLRCAEQYWYSNDPVAHFLCLGMQNRMKFLLSIGKIIRTRGRFLSEDLLGRLMRIDL